jgi:hypothetical protein
MFGSCGYLRNTKLLALISFSVKNKSCMCGELTFKYILMMSSFAYTVVDVNIGLLTQTRPDSHCVGRTIGICGPPDDCNRLGLFYPRVVHHFSDTLINQTIRVVCKCSSFSIQLLS